MVMAVGTGHRGWASASPARDQVVLVAALLAVAALGWVVTDVQMRGMDAGPGTDLGALGLYTGNWVVMMAAMMFPSILPMVLGYARVEQGMRTRHGRGSSLGFVSGYLVIWTVFGLLAYGLFDGIKALSIGALRWDDAGRYVAGGVIVLAAVYQLTPAKDACLRRCRDPFTFLAEEWRDGRLGAVQMGALHGAWCVGCCWALMAALFALGAMSLGWMVLVAAMIAVEKLMPSRAIATYAVAIAFLVLGTGVAFVPGHVPGLTVPGSAAALQSRQSMQMPMSPRHMSGSMSSRSTSAK